MGECVFDGHATEVGTSNYAELTILSGQVRTTLLRPAQVQQARAPQTQDD